MRHALSLFALLLTLSLPAAAAPNGMVALLTDYGADTIYVGVLRGAILSKNPNARVETVTNSVPNYDIVSGAYLLAEACKQWPAGTTFCCVVDPGVGTPRKSIALETKAGQYFVGPDNGLLALVAQRDGIAALHEATDAKFFGPNALSSTFQGRDIYGPVAASIAGGATLSDLGPKLDALVPVAVEEARVEDGAIHGVVIRSDDYGNLVTNIPAELMAKIGVEKGGQVDAQIGDTKLTLPYRNTYADVEKGEPLLCAQSIGMVEAAVNQGSMAALANAGAHAKVVLRNGLDAEGHDDAEQVEILLHFSQSGGFTGMTQEVTLSTSGQATISAPRRSPTEQLRSTTMRLPKKEFARLHTLAKEAFAGIPKPTIGPRMGGADYMTYVIRFGGQVKTVTDLDMPNSFKPLVRALVDLAAKHGR